MQLLSSLPLTVLIASQLAISPFESLHASYWEYVRTNPMTDAEESVLDSRVPYVTLPIENDSENRANTYIVRYKDWVNVDELTQDIFEKHGVQFAWTYSKALKGFSATLDEEQLRVLKNDPRIADVARDRELRITFQSLPTGVERIRAHSSARTGGGIGVAVLDTGADIFHPDLWMNMTSGKSCIRGARSAQDDNGHGTHVAGIIAASDDVWGVVGAAPNSHIIPVKVFDRRGVGTWSTVICGIDWLVANAERLNIKVVNMSFGGVGTSDNNCGITNSDPLHTAICRARDMGITFVAAAGNQAKEASTTVPAAYDDAVITVSALADSDGTSGGRGASTRHGADDTFATFSNYGSVVDIAAPGVDITSTWLWGSYKTISGTSMAAPHISASAALYLESHEDASWIEVRDAIKSRGEALGLGHTDSSGNHPEPVAQVNDL